jgi:hypothetical protein
MELFLSITGSSSTKHGIRIDCSNQILLIRPNESKKAQRFQSYYVIAKDCEVATYHKGNYQFKTKIFRISQRRYS